MRIAAFDFGSNSIKCLIADFQPSGISELANLRVQNRLASFLDNGRLHSDATDHTLKLLLPLMGHCHSLQVQQYLAVGTQALRVAANRKDFVQAIELATGLRIHVLSGEEEASLAWQGVISGLPVITGELCLFDSGGASTEFIWGNSAGIRSSHSFPLGAVALHKEFIHSDPVQQPEIKQLEKAITARMQYPWPGTCQLLGIGGGVLACAKIAMGKEISDLTLLEGLELSRHELERQIRLYRCSSLEQRRHIPGMEAGREDIILPGAILFLSILNSLSQSSFRISTRGLRQGVILRECNSTNNHSLR